MTDSSPMPGGPRLTPDLLERLAAFAKENGLPSYWSLVPLIRATELVEQYAQDRADSEFHDPAEDTPVPFESWVEGYVEACVDDSRDFARDSIVDALEVLPDPASPDFQALTDMLT